MGLSMEIAISVIYPDPNKQANEATFCWKLNSSDFYSHLLDWIILVLLNLSIY